MPARAVMMARGEVVSDSRPPASPEKWKELYDSAVRGVKGGGA